MASNPRIVAAPGSQEGGGGGVPKWVWYAGGAIVGIVIIFFVLKPGSGSGTPIQATQGASGGGPSLSDLLNLWSQAQQNQGGGVTTNPPTGGGTDPSTNPSSGFVTPVTSYPGGFGAGVGAAQTPSGYTPYSQGFGSQSAAQTRQRWGPVNSGFGGVSASQTNGPVLPPQPANRNY